MKISSVYKYFLHLLCIPIRYISCLILQTLKGLPRHDHLLEQRRELRRNRKRKKA